MSVYWKVFGKLKLYLKHFIVFISLEMMFCPECVLALHFFYVDELDGYNFVECLEITAKMVFH